MATRPDTPPRLPLRDLLLDEENPRLASSILGKPTQEELVRVLWEDMAVDEVGLSIEANGYYDHEPLIVIPGRGKAKGKYIVVEGNRRLAAVMLLTDSKLNKRIGANLPAASKKRKKELESLPVSIHASRKELWSYLGFRHINGTKPWDSFSKAEYVAHVRREYDISLREIAKRIGDRHSTVLRLYNGYVVLRQAETSAGFDRSDRIRNRFYYSHLYTAIDQPEFRVFLGLQSGELSANPVRKSKRRELRELMIWLYGRQSTNTQPVILSQNPDLNHLREILGNTRALASLRKGSSLQRAHEISIGDEQRFKDALATAKEDLQEAKATVTTGYRGERDLAALMDEIQRLASSIEREMEGIGTSKRRRKA